MLFILDAASGSSKWSIHYVIPFLVMLATMFVTIIVLLKRMKWREYIGYLSTMVILGFILVLLFLSSWSTVLWQCASTALFVYFIIYSCSVFFIFLFKRFTFKRVHCFICFIDICRHGLIFRKNDEK